MTTSPDLQLRTERHSGGTTVFVTGEVDYGSASRLRSALVELAHENTDVIVDLSAVTFIDSTALSVLVQAKQRFDSTGQSMSVTGTQPRVARVFELSGLSDYLGGDGGLQGRGDSPSS